MEMDYKKSLGGKSITRDQWLALHQQLHNKESPNLIIDGKKSARELIDYNLIHNRPSSDTAPVPKKQKIDEGQISTSQVTSKTSPRGVPDKKKKSKPDVKV